MGQARLETSTFQDVAAAARWRLPAAAKGERSGPARERTVERFGAAYGPHGPDVVVFDDVRKPNLRRSDALSVAARERNLRIRDLGHLPYVGPGASSVGLMLPPLLAGEEALASVLLNGIYFGVPARLASGLYPRPRPLAAEVKATLAKLHGRLAVEAASLDTALH